MRVINKREDISKLVNIFYIKSSFSKEIRILLKREQIMKEHKAPFPIIVHILKGKIDFGVQGQLKSITEGGTIQT